MVTIKIYRKKLVYFKIFNITRDQGLKMKQTLWLLCVEKNCEKNAVLRVFGAMTLKGLNFAKKSIFCQTGRFPQDREQYCRIF